MAKSAGLRTSLAGWAASLAPLFRARTPTTSTTPTGSAGNVAPIIHPTYTFGNQSSTGPQPKPGNDPTALWGNLDINRFNNVFSPGTLFGPERPLVPIEYENVRLRNYPVGYNLQYTPRSWEQVGFAELRAIAREVVLVRLAIETRKDQIEKLDWNIKPIDEKNAPASSVKRAEAMEKFWHKPDGVQSFAGWLRETLEEVLVIDAPAFEVRRTRGGDIIGLDVISGDTIKVLIDESGRWPKPPAPAFLQVIHGRPWRLLTSDQMIYAPRNRLATSPYGYSPVEQTLLIANIALRRSLKQLAHFTTGNVPAGMITGGEGWSPETLKNYYEFLNSELAGNVANQTQLYLAPFGAQYQTFTEAPYKDDFDEWLARIISYAFSLPPTWAVKQMNRATAGSAQEAALEEGLAPIQSWVKRLVDEVMQVRMGQPDLEFVWADEEDIDQQTQSAIVDQKLRAGRLTLNEARDLDGLEPVAGGDEPMIYLPTGPVLLRDVEAISDLAANPPKPIMAPSPNAAPGRGSSGGKPAPGKPGAGKPGAKPAAKPAAKPKAASPQNGAKKPPASARNSPAQSRKNAGSEDPPFFPSGEADIAELLAKGKGNVDPANAVPVGFPLADPITDADIQHLAWGLVCNGRMQLEERTVPTSSLVATQQMVDSERVAREAKKWRHRGQGKFLPLVMDRGDRMYVLRGHHHASAGIDAGATEIRVQVLSDKEQ